MGLFRRSQNTDSNLIRTPSEYNEQRKMFVEKTVFDYDIVTACAENKLGLRMRTEREYIARQEQIVRIIKAKWDFIGKFHKNHVEAYAHYPNPSSVTCSHYEDLVFIGDLPAWRMHSVAAPVSWREGCFYIGTDGSVYLGVDYNLYKNVDATLHDFTVEQLSTLADLLEAYVSGNVLQTVVRLMTKNANTS